jgi:hypothetical protein
LTAIRQAVERSETTLGQAAEMRILQDRYASLWDPASELVAEALFSLDQHPDKPVQPVALILSANSRRCVPAVATVVSLAALPKESVCRKTAQPFGPATNAFLIPKFTFLAKIFAL